MSHSIYHRSLQALCGLTICAFGAYLQLIADIGMSPWESLNQGIAMHLPIQYGTASVLVSLFVLIAAIALKENIGIGTLLDAFYVGKATDLFDIIPACNSFAERILLFVIGMIVNCVGQRIYISAELCCGPRDSLLIGIGKRVPNLPIGAVSFGLFAVVFLFARLLGSKFGAGTILGTFGTGIVMQAVFQLLHFEPRDVHHENLSQTVCKIVSGRRCA